MSETRALTLRELHHLPHAPTIHEPAPKAGIVPRSRRYAWIAEDPDLAPAPRAEMPLTAWT